MAISKDRDDGSDTDHHNELQLVFNQCMTYHINLYIFYSFLTSNLQLIYVLFVVYRGHGGGAGGCEGQCSAAHADVENI